MKNVCVERRRGAVSVDRRGRNAERTRTEDYLANEVPTAIVGVDSGVLAVGDCQAIGRTRSAREQKRDRDATDGPLGGGRILASQVSILSRAKVR